MSQYELNLHQNVNVQNSINNIDVTTPSTVHE